MCHYTLPTAPRLYTDTNNLLTRQVPAVPGQAPIAEQRTARQVRFHAPLMELNGRPPRHATTSRGLFLLVNTKCDLACSYCFYTTDHEARDDDILAIPTPELIEHLRTLHFGSVILSGGDPLNRASKASTIDLVRELVAGGLQVIVNTSAAFLTDDDCRHLAAARPTRVDISIDSVNTRVHNLLRGRHTDTVAAVRNLVASVCRVWRGIRWPHPTYWTGHVPAVARELALQAIEDLGILRLETKGLVEGLRFWIVPVGRPLQPTAAVLARDR